DRQRVGVVSFAEVRPETDGQRAVEREALAVVEDPGAEVAPDQDAGVAAIDVGEAGPETDIVLVLPVAVEALHREVDPFAGIGDGGADLVLLEWTVGSLEDRREGLLRLGGLSGATDQSQPHDTSPEATTHATLLERVRPQLAPGCPRLGE